ncbi:recombinase family protein [Arthrobacter oryzae]|uniref:recombinase family protein n=1 Tax=Arthrobacter oryzae TaxID=409290 RepID=UPI0030C9910B
MKATTYVRQSRQRGDESQGSPEARRKQTRALIDSRGWTFVEHYQDLGASGYDPTAARPRLDAALAAIAEGRAVYRLDRLTRRGVGEATRIVDELRRNGASFVSAYEPSTTSARN